MCAAQVVCPDKWKDGAKNTIEGGGRKINENKLLAKNKRWAALCKTFRHSTTGLALPLLARGGCSRPA
jgi:hypothetical protein